MALRRTWAVALFGVDGRLVEIEADVRRGGLPNVQLLGLPDTALQEAKNRVRAAVQNSREDWPQSCVTLALSPAALPKAGTSYDLALACAVLAGAEQVPPQLLEGTVLFGELALDGRLRSVRGLLPALLAARREGVRRAVVPVAGLAEGQLVDGLEVLGAHDLAEVVRWLRGQAELVDHPAESATGPAVAAEDLVDVLGQPEARWALEVAAAGGHHLLLVGPPGTGKTMLARRLGGLLPDLTRQEALEVTAIHSVAGELVGDAPLVAAPPFVAPHHSTSVPGLIGGGSGLARPGAVSRAHRGTLFLDEACEFGPQRLEALRTALEEGEVRLSRRDGTLRYPARFQLVLATNPCPCAPARDADCHCAPQARRRYFGKLSGPLLDRVDLRVDMRPVTAMTMRGGAPPESSEEVRARVSRAVGRRRAVVGARVADQRRGAGAGAAPRIRLAGQGDRVAGPRPGHRCGHRARCRSVPAGGVDAGRSGRAGAARGRARGRGAGVPGTEAGMNGSVQVVRTLHIDRARCVDSAPAAEFRGERGVR